MSDILPTLKNMVDAQLHKKNAKAEKRKWGPAEKLMHIITSNRKHFSKMRTSGSDKIVKLTLEILNQKGFPSKSLHNNLLASQQNNMPLSEELKKRLLNNLIKEFSEKAHHILPAFKSLTDQIETYEEAHNYVKVMFENLCENELEQLGFNLEAENSKKNLYNLIDTKTFKALENVLNPIPPITSPEYYNKEKKYYRDVEKNFKDAYNSENLTFIKAYHEFNDAIFQNHSEKQKAALEILKTLILPEHSPEVIKVNIGAPELDRLRILFNREADPLYSTVYSSAEMQFILENFYKNSILTSILNDPGHNEGIKKFAQECRETPSILSLRSVLIKTDRRLEDDAKEAGVLETIYFMKAYLDLHLALMRPDSEDVIQKKCKTLLKSAGFEKKVINGKEVVECSLNLESKNKNTLYDLLTEWSSDKSHDLLTALNSAYRSNQHGLRQTVKGKSETIDAFIKWVDQEAPPPSKQKPVHPNTSGLPSTTPPLLFQGKRPSVSGPTQQDSSLIMPTTIPDPDDTKPEDMPTRKRSGPQ